MVTRNRFFRASLRAALAPTVMLVAAAVFLILFPKFHKLGDMVVAGSGLALIGVPFAYTVFVVGSYCVGRALHDFRILNRMTLVIVYSAFAAACAWVMTWWIAAGETVDILRSFALFLVLGLTAAGCTAFIWWRIVTRVETKASPIEDDQLRVRRRRQRRGFFRRLANKW